MRKWFVKKKKTVNLRKRYRGGPLSTHPPMKQCDYESIYHYRGVRARTAVSVFDNGAREGEEAGANGRVLEETTNTSPEQKQTRKLVFHVK